MTPTIVGNWKMNGTLESARTLTTELKTGLLKMEVPLPHVVVCPPYIHLTAVGDITKGSPLTLGAQNCSAQNSGAFTGDISPDQLKDAGAQFVILGHSERREQHGETSALIATKVQAAIACGLTPIICIGESLAQREAGETLSHLSTQLAESLPQGINLTNLLVAYEPIWAIGTGKIPTSAQIAEVHAHVRSCLSDDTIPLLYGGSVTDRNALELLEIPHVNGVLVGGASLKSNVFLSIIEAASSVMRHPQMHTRTSS